MEIKLFQADLFLYLISFIVKVGIQASVITMTREYDYNYDPMDDGKGRESFLFSKLELFFSFLFKVRKKI